MKADWLNLASGPFVNVRPVRRVGSLLWVAGVGLAVINGWLYWTYFSGSGEMRELLLETERSIGQEEAAVADLDRQIESLDLVWMNEQVEFLNLEITARTFPWSELFDRLVEVLPDDVRLIRLNPELGAKRQQRRNTRRAVAKRTEVTMQLEGEARDDEQLLAFVDAFFAHPSFRNPSLATESRRAAGDVVFVLTVEYLPGTRLTAIEAEIQTDPETASEPGLEIAPEVGLEAAIEPAVQTPAESEADTATEGEAR